MVKIKSKKNNWIIDKVEAVFFDKDGTIIDSHFYWGRIIELRSKAIISKFKLHSSIHKNLCLTMGYSIDQKKLLKQGPIALVSRNEVIQIVLRFLSENNCEITFDEISDIFLEVHENFKKEIKILG